MTRRRGCGTPQSGKELRAFTGHADRVSSVAFSPDGKQVLTGS